MYTRVISSQYQPGKTGEVLQIYRETILPSLRQQSGFKGVIGLVDHHTDKAMSITLWETAADPKADATSDHLRAQLAKVVPFLASAPVIETVEVSIRETEMGTTAQYTRITAFQLQPQTTDGFVQVVRTTVLPVARQQQGTKGILVLTIEKV